MKKHGKAYEPRPAVSTVTSKYVIKTPITTTRHGKEGSIATARRALLHKGELGSSLGGDGSRNRRRGSRPAPPETGRGWSSGAVQ